MLNEANQILISFVVPVYNVGKYLELCIKSMIQITEDNIEVILIDDGSTDGSGKICDKYAALDCRVKVIHQKNQGTSIARNIGIDNSCGKWICFIDGDDWLERGFVAKLEPYLRDEYDIVFFQFNEVKGKTKKTSQSCFPQLPSIVTDFDFFQQATLNRFLCKYYVASPWSKVFRKSFLDENNLRYVPGIIKAQDTLFVLEAYGKASKGQMIEEILYNYNVHSDSVSRKFNPNIVEIHNQLIYELNRVVYSKNKLKKDLECALNVAIFRYFMVCIQVDFCHKDNLLPYIKRKTMYMETRNMDVYANAIKKADMSRCRFTERILSILIKINTFRIIDFLFKMRSKIRF